MHEVKVNVINNIWKFDFIRIENYFKKACVYIH